MWKRRLTAAAVAFVLLMMAACNQNGISSSDTSSFSSSSSSDSSSDSSEDSEAESESNSDSEEDPDSDSSETEEESNGGAPSSNSTGEQPSGSGGTGGGQASQGGQVQQPSSSAGGGGESADPGFSWDPGGNYTGGISIRTASAPGTQVASGADGSAIDYSNTAQGYVMVKKASDTKTKVRVQGPNGGTYQRYILPSAGTYYPIPLQMGNGNYTVTIYVNTSGDKYAAACTVSFSASPGTNCYLYPNIYANYNSGSAAVRKSFGLCMNASNDLDKVKSIYNYIITHVSYDYPKASSVTSSYVPNPDSTLASGRGICFDYAALMATMCRAQGIPTKVVMGTTKGAAHAWNEVYIQNVGWIAVGIPSNGGWKRLDATFGTVNGASYTENSGNYVTQQYY